MHFPSLANAAWTALLRDLDTQRTYWKNGWPTWFVQSEADLVWHFAWHLAQVQSPLDRHWIHFEHNFKGRTDRAGRSLATKRADLAIVDPQEVPGNENRLHFLALAEAKFLQLNRRSDWKKVETDYEKLRLYVSKGVTEFGLLLVVDQREMRDQDKVAEYRRLIRPQQRLLPLVFDYFNRKPLVLRHPIGR